VGDVIEREEQLRKQVMQIKELVYGQAVLA